MGVRGFGRFVAFRELSLHDRSDARLLRSLKGQRHPGDPALGDGHPAAGFEFSRHAGTSRGFKTRAGIDGEAGESK